MAWQIAAAFAAASGFRSAASQRKAGSIAMREARAQAAEMRRQKFDVALAASQQHENRMEQFRDLVAYNEAAAAYAGRTGRSLAALRKREEKLYGRDVTRLRQQEQREKESLEKEAQVTERRGRVDRNVYREQAKSTLLGTGYNVASLL